uniref:Uncharacterized protein n=1 Tax=Picea sitchensis TaxID=3332 RepID=A9NYM2_PICSI|nr:unknown [Picea sitchensis]
MMKPTNSLRMMIRETLDLQKIVLILALWTTKSYRKALATVAKV